MILKTDSKLLSASEIGHLVRVGVSLKFLLDLFKGIHGIVYVIQGMGGGGDDTEHDDTLRNHRVYHH